MNAYRNFAQLYDRLMQDAPYDRWLEFTSSIIEASEVESIVDLGCGTGEITRRLVTPNHLVYGVDLSEEMLAVASQKTGASQVNWIQQDIVNLSGFSNIDVMLSYCDVVNYIVTKNSVRQFFTRVSQSLAEDGVFIFDVHNLAYVKRSLLDQTFTFVSDDISYIWDCQSGENEGDMIHHLTFFHQDELEAGLYYRFDERHHQRSFSIETYLKLLKQARFEHVELYADFSLENDFDPDRAERIFFVAYKK